MISDNDQGYKDINGQIERSIKFYSNRFLLYIYDLNVTYFNNAFAWKCSRQKIINHYTARMHGNHLEVGVASTHYLRKALRETPVKSVSVMDLNQKCLDKAARQLKGLNPNKYQRNILQAIENVNEKFDSIGLNYVLHVVPGSIEEKACIFINLKSMLKPDGVLFGSTLLTSGVNRNWLSILLMAGANRKGYFNNSRDSLSGLEKSLKKYFKYVNIEVVGSVALFEARG